jgi:hypothetical protein
MLKTVYVINLLLLNNQKSLSIRNFLFIPKIPNFGYLINLMNNLIITNFKVLFLLLDFEKYEKISSPHRNLTCY